MTPAVSNLLALRPSGLAELPEFAAMSMLALIQGLTEFLPVSSSGHLVLAQEAMGWTEPDLTVDIALHFGTLLAVVFFYRRDLAEILRDVVRGRLRELGLLFLASLPVAVLGIGFKAELEHVFGRPAFAAWGLLATTLFLIVGEFGRRRLPPDESGEAAAARAIGWKDALVIGIAQSLAIWPGISRSGSTIATGMLMGLEPKQAARFSFLLSIPAILGAAAVDLPKALEGGTLGSTARLLWSMAFAALVGWAALRVLLAFLGRGAFLWFAAYCALLGGGYLLLR